MVTVGQTYGIDYHDSSFRLFWPNAKFHEVDMNMLAGRFVTIFVRDLNSFLKCQKVTSYRTLLQDHLPRWNTLSAVILPP